MSLARIGMAAAIVAVTLQSATSSRPRTSAGVRLNLGDCYDKLGRTAAASADLARSRLTALKPRLSLLAVKVPPDAAVARLEIASDHAAGTW